MIPAMHYYFILFLWPFDPPAFLASYLLSIDTSHFIFADFGDSSSPISVDPLIRI